MKMSQIGLIVRAIIHRKKQSDFVDIFCINKSKVSRVFKGKLDISNINSDVLAYAANSLPLPMLEESSLPKIDIEPPELRNEVFSTLFRKHKNTPLDAPLHVIQSSWLIKHKSSYCPETGKVIVNENDLSSAEELLIKLTKLDNTMEWKKTVYAFFSRHNIIGINMLREASKNKLFTSNSLVNESLDLVYDLFAHMKNYKLTEAMKENLEYIFITTATQTKEILFLSKCFENIDKITDMETHIFGEGSTTLFDDLLNASAWSHTTPIIEEFISFKDLNKKKLVS